jgi:hypothetical protein
VPLAPLSSLALLAPPLRSLVGVGAINGICPSPATFGPGDRKSLRSGHISLGSILFRRRRRRRRRRRKRIKRPKGNGPEKETENETEKETEKKNEKKHTATGSLMVSDP